jgi:hypothetical protein
MKRPPLVGLWLLLVIGAVAIGTHALAADAKVFNGSMCSFA